MFKKLKELKEFLNLRKSIEEKEPYLKELEVKIENKEEMIEEIKAKALETIKDEIEHLETQKVKLTEDVLNEEKNLEKSQKELKRNSKKLDSFKTEFLGVRRLLEEFPLAIDFKKIEEQLNIVEDSVTDGILNPIVALELHHKESKVLRQDMNKNNKEIKKLLESYEGKYTSKANKTIYSLMVVGLQAELQNILYTLTYTNIDKALENAKNLIEKYRIISIAGSANILPTITRFLAELEPLFENAIKIEYRYYVQKEKEKEEQKRIREQMRQEAEERKLLEQERKKIEQEEAKYLQEIENNAELLRNEKDEKKIALLQQKLKELEEKMQKVEEQKEEIVKRANGKAGYVYVISNLGSFGESMFKIGMTRRLNPDDRIDELGDASVPFKFDVHAMIFSEDAVQLEQKLHQRMNDERVNKINLRKEFFYSDVATLQDLVQDIDPAAEFTTVMTASEYRQSESLRNEKEEIEYV